MESFMPWMGMMKFLLLGDLNFSLKKENNYPARRYWAKKIEQSAISGGSSVADAAKIFKTILDGKGTDAQNNVVLTNAAFALKVVEQTKSFETCFEEAKESLFGLKAKACLTKLVE